MTDNKTKIENVPLLNEELLITQKVSTKAQEEMKEIYSLLGDVLFNPDNYEDVVQVVEEIEFKLQELWNFPQTKDKHRYWNQLRGCKCNTLDQRDLWGTGFRLLYKDCKFHGGSVEN